MVSSLPHGKKRYKAFVSYDGTEFHGFAENPGVETVAGKIRESLEMILGGRVDITCAGRTDAGVHAEGQVISFDTQDFDYSRVQKSLNKLCAPYISIRNLQEAEDHFSARFSAITNICTQEVHPSTAMSTLRISTLGCTCGSIWICIAAL